MMFKRLFWFALGFAAGVITVAKAQAYMRAHMPSSAGNFLFGPDQNNVTLRTLGSLIAEFNAKRRARETELNEQYGAAPNAQ